MRKTGSNASWNRLSPEQRLELARWLFEEKIGYEKALTRARKKFGFAGSVSGLRRFYKRTWEERLLTGSEMTETMVAAVEEAGSSAERMRSAGMKLVARMFLQKVLETPKDLKEWGPLAKLLLQSEDNELRRQLKSEENDLRRQQLEFARSRHQFDMVESARKVLPQLQEMEEARKAAKDPEAWELEENRRLNDMVLRMFGDCVPELRPETPEEKANPELVRQRVAKLHRHAEARFAAQRAALAEERRKETEAKANAERGVRSAESMAREEHSTFDAERSTSRQEDRIGNGEERREDRDGTVIAEGGVQNAERGVRSAELEGKGIVAASHAGGGDENQVETAEERRRRSEELMQRAYELRRQGL